MSELSDNIEKFGPAHTILRALIHFEILNLTILRKLLQSHGQSDIQIFGINTTAFMLSFILWIQFFSNFSLGGEREQNERFLEKFRRAPFHRP